MVILPALTWSFFAVLGATAGWSSLVKVCWLSSAGFPMVMRAPVSLLPRVKPVEVAERTLYSPLLVKPLAGAVDVYFTISPTLKTLERQSILEEGRFVPMSVTESAVWLTMPSVTGFANSK